jgi:hypothetical protein
VETWQLSPKHRRATSSLGHRPQIGSRGLLSLGVASKTPISFQSLGITSKMLTPPSSRSALPPKRRLRVQSLGITSKMLMSLSDHSALPLKR